jgi:hypothetical protein
MRDLAEAVPEPIWPFGIRLISYKEYSDLETILQAVDEAFEDHWGHIDHSDDQERIERFRHRSKATMNSIHQSGIWQWMGMKLRE